ncbi:hypothetical protein ACI65C_005966 [Semiaphis heraclei]
MMTTVSAVDWTTSVVDWAATLPQVPATDSNAMAATATARAIAAPPPVAWTTLPSDTAEIATLSEQINRALECPICLKLMSVMSCFCPNGHALCRKCMLTISSTGGGTNDMSVLCPLCRTSMVNLSSISAMTIKLSQLTAFVRVACPHQPFGCPVMVPVQLFHEHQSVCMYVPDVSCQVAVCQWVGMYEQLYEHVHKTHPGFALQTPVTNTFIFESYTTIRLKNNNTIQLSYTINIKQNLSLPGPFQGNRLKVTDIQEILKNRRRTYLVQSTYGMFWVLLSRKTQSRIQTGLFMVENTQPTLSRQSTPNPNRTNPLEPDIVYRVTWFDCDGRSSARSKTNTVKWSTVLKEGDSAVLTDTYSMFRFYGSLEINWFPSLQYYFNRRANPWT